jgi:hypothetical protein
MKLYRFDNKMQMQRVKLYPYIILLSCTFLLLSMQKSESSVNYEPEILVINDLQSTKTEDFNFKDFRQFILDCHLKFPDIILAQAMEESGQFTSKIWKENHNPFGMKTPRSRMTTNIGENRGHAKFLNWKMAVLDYLLLQNSYTRGINTRKGYYKYLKSYAENPNYEKKIKYYLWKYKGFGISDDYMYDL